MRKITLFLFLLSLLFMFACDNAQADKVSLSDKLIREHDSLQRIQAHADSEAMALRVCRCVDTVVVDSLRPSPAFAKAAKIVSFEFADAITKREPVYENIIEGGVLRRKQIVQQIDITPWKLQLERILLNKKEVCTIGRLPPKETCLYAPHHCIVFYDRNNRPIDFIEICFMCNKVMTSKADAFGPFCNSTFCELRKLFKEAGHRKGPLLLPYCPELLEK